MTTSNCKGAWDMDFSPVPWKKRKQFFPPDLFLIEKTNVSILLYAYLISKAVYPLYREIVTQTSIF